MLSSGPCRYGHKLHAEMGDDTTPLMRALKFQVQSGCFLKHPTTQSPVRNHYFAITSYNLVRSPHHAAHWQAKLAQSLQ